MNPEIPIEDLLEDVLQKAMGGLGLSLDVLSKQTGLSCEVIRPLLQGHADRSVIHQIAPKLDLNADGLYRLAKGPEAPRISLPDGIQLHNTPHPVPGYQEMTVNSYTATPPGHSSEGVIIDAGAPLKSIKQARNGVDLTSWKLFLTHTHSDHVTYYDDLSTVTQQSYTPAAEPYKNAKLLKEDDNFTFGPWHLKALSTPGHSPGGTTYLLSGADVPVAFVGDALFCYSVGKIRSNYKSSLEAIRQKILSLPNEAILCPGHGPVTNVGHEKENNPFFA